MIIGKNDNVLEKSKDFESKSFGIKNLKKVFRILIDGIYQNPYESIIREIVSNAIDANKESKSNEKVVVNFIEADELAGIDYTLIIKDFGVGISEDRMYDIFCFIGESTKDLDNEFIGGLNFQAPLLSN